MPKTPTLTQVIRNAFDAMSADLHTWLPGKVETFHADDFTVDVTPMLKRKYKGESAVTLPTLPRVPLAIPRAGTAWFKMPVKEGDQVILLFCERSLDRWFDLGGIQDPQDARRHHLSDAVAIPGVYDRKQALTAKGAATSLEIAFGDAWIEITADGKIKIRNQAGADLLSSLSDLVGALQSATTMTTMGPQPLDVATQTKLATIKTQIDSLKG